MVPFTLALGANGFVVVGEELFGLRFRFQIATMYVEQEVYKKAMKFQKHSLCKEVEETTCHGS